MNCNVGKEAVPDFAELEKGTDDKGRMLCPVNWTKECIQAARRHICGKSVACRDGLTQMYLITEDITSGAGRPSDLELLKQIASYVAEAEGCETSKKAAVYTLKSLELYREEWENHCRRKRCRAFVCKSYYSVVCYPEKCQGCTVCMEVCPAGAISGGPGLICVVDESLCLRCGRCMEVCPHGARGKVWDIRPQLPDSPVPVGSFSLQASGRRRKRKPHIHTPQ
jgi:NADH-quinone oxidoreductase subunit F